MAALTPIPQMTHEELALFDIEANLGLANIEDFEEDQEYDEVDPSFNLLMEIDKTQNVKSKTPPISPEKAPTRLRLGVHVPGRKAPLGNIVRRKLFIEKAGTDFSNLYKRDVKQSLASKREAREAYSERGQAYLGQAREATQLGADFSRTLRYALSNDGRKKVAEGERPNFYVPLSGNL